MAGWKMSASWSGVGAFGSSGEAVFGGWVGVKSPEGDRSECSP